MVLMLIDKSYRHMLVLMIFLIKSYFESMITEVVVKAYLPGRYESNHLV